MKSYDISIQKTIAQKKDAHLRLLYVSYLVYRKDPAICQQTRDIWLMLLQCWASAEGDGPIF